MRCKSDRNSRLVMPALGRLLTLSHGSFCRSCKVIHATFLHAQSWVGLPGAYSTLKSQGYKLIGLQHYTTVALILSWGRLLLRSTQVLKYTQPHPVCTQAS